MDSIASKRNDSPFRTSNSYAASRRLDNLPRRQSSTLAGSCSSFRSGFSPQRTPYDTRQSLSRSYDSPEGIRRMSQLSARKSSSTNFRRAASPPACSSSPKQHVSGSSRNQTILDDAAWMSERIHKLQRTGILRYPSISKMHGQSEISLSLHSPSANNKVDEKISPGCLNQISTIRHSQTVMNQADEALSAFKLSEVTLSEEDLLTDITCSSDLSTCTSTPILLPSSSSFDQIGSECYLGSPLSQDVGKDYQKYMQQSNVSPNPNGNPNHPHSAAASESTSSDVRGDLLLRLEALQCRAELAAKRGNTSFLCNTSASQDNHSSKHFGSEQIPHWDPNVSSSNQKWSTFSQQSYAASSASPTHSQLSIESIPWPEEPENSLNSTCWLKDIKEEAKTEPFATHLYRSTSRTIRPEYYLPLSKEEEPVLESPVSPFSSPIRVKRTELRNDNIRRLALSVCHQSTEEMRPGKSVNNHKHRPLAQKSQRVLQSCTSSAHGYGSVKAGGGTPALSSPKSSLGVTGRTFPTEARSSQNHLCAEYKGNAHLMQKQIKNTNQSFEIKAFSSGMDGQQRNSLENQFEYDGESSWISEENVEGFLCSQSYTLDEADALNTSNEWSSTFLDRNLIHSTALTTSSSSSQRPTQNKSIGELVTKDSGKGSSQTQTACLNEKAIVASNQSIAGIHVFDRCKEVHLSSQGGSIITSQTDTHLQLFKGPLADSCQAANISHQSVCQISHSGDEGIKNNLIACCNDDFNNERVLKEFHNDVGVKERMLGKGDSSSQTDVSADLNIVIEDSVENNMILKEEKKLESTGIGQCHSARYSFHSSIPSVSEQQVPLPMDSLSSPAELLVEDHHSSAIANKNDNTTPMSKVHSHNLSDAGFSEHKIFTRIVRSLSFSERGESELKTSSKIQISRDASESKCTSLAPSSDTYSLTSCDLENNEGKLLQTSARITKELLQEIQSQKCMENLDRGSEGNGASLILLEKSCTTDFNIEKLAEEPCVMTHTLLLSKSESDANLSSGCEAPQSIENSSLQCHDLQLDCPIETHFSVQDESKIGRGQEDTKSWQQVISRVPKASKTEIDDKGCHQQSGENFTIEESLCTKTLQEETEPEVIFEKSTLSEEHMGILSLANQSKGVMVEGVNKGEMVLKFSCTSGPENGRKGKTPCGRGETPSSLLSIYKNPLWRDEVNVNFDNSHSSQNQEFLDHSYSDEGNFLDSDKNRIGFSKRSLGAVWDTYEGMGGFIDSFPNSPSCTTKQTSEANHILVEFDSLVNSTESNSLVLDSVWDAESSLKKLRKIGEEASEVPGVLTQPRWSGHSQIEQCSQAANSLETTESQTMNNDASSSCSEAMKRNLTIERDSIYDSARIHDGLEDCLTENSIRPYASSSQSTKLIDSNAKCQDAAFLADVSTTKEFFPNSETKCYTWKKMAPVTEMSCKIDEGRAGREAFDQLDCNCSKTGRELTAQNSGTSINLEMLSASQCADRKLQTNPLCEQHNKECVQPLHHKFGFAKADAPEENHSIKDLVMHSNDGMEAGEEVKQVTFVYSDPKEPQKDLQTVEASLPEVPLELLSTWVLSFFTHASKGGINVKKKEQKQPLIQDKAQEDKAELKRIGRKVQALEAEIDRFKQENRKLQSLVKCMIRKIKQLQQGLRGRKRNGSSRGFMTCIYSVRVKRSSKSKVSRKS